jgi:hypothetical protein
MHMLRHYDISRDEEIMLLAHPFQRFFKQVARTLRAEKRLALITTESDEMKIAAFLVTNQSQRHAGILNPGMRMLRIFPR